MKLPKFLISATTLNALVAWFGVALVGMGISRQFGAGYGLASAGLLLYLGQLIQGK